MKPILIMALAAFLISGCAPKMGEDIALEMDSNIRIENSGADVVLGILSILSGSDKRIALKIGGDLTVINRWHSDLELRSLEYALVDEKGTLAEGFAKIDSKHPFIVSAHAQKKLPLSLELDRSSFDLARIMAVTGSKGKAKIKGEAVICVWGKEMRYPFEKDAKKIFETLSHTASAR